MIILEIALAYLCFVAGGAFGVVYGPAIEAWLRRRSRIDGL